MAKIVEILAPESSPAAGHHLSLSDIFRYAQLLEEVVSVWNGVHDLPVGGEADVPAIKVRIGGAHYTWQPSKITRDS